MATLVEGREYGLASNGSTSGNKTFIHLKLTDSALRALEEFSKSRVRIVFIVQFSEFSRISRNFGLLNADFAVLSSL